jgi:general stress protein 26
MSSNGDIDQTGNLWFFTSVSSHKVSEIENTPKVNVSFADPENQRYVSVTGVANLVRDRKKIEELWRPEFRMWFPEGKDDPEIALMQIKLEKAEYWDSPSSTIGFALSFVSSLITGKQPDFGENKKLDLGDDD